MADARVSQPRVVFGYGTALQMLRMSSQSVLSAGICGSFVLPERPPHVDDLRMLLDRIESAHPGLRLERPVDLLVSTSNCRKGGLYVPHVHTGSLPGSSFLRLEGDILFGGAELALVQAAQGRSEVQLLELLWEACGSYQTRRTGVSAGYQVKSLTSVRALREYVTRNPSIHGARKVARILALVADGSASARETKLALVLGSPLAQGGGGLGIPRMNFEVAANASARAISGRRSFRCDLCWPEAKLDVEYQSKERHEGEGSRIRDSRRANALAAMGWTVIGVTNDELDSVVAMDAITEAIRRRLGKRQRMRVSDYHARKLRLRRQLGLPVGYD